MKTTRQKFSTEYLQMAEVKDASLKYSFVRNMHEQTSMLVNKFDYEVRVISANFLDENQSTNGFVSAPDKPEIEMPAKQEEENKEPDLEIDSKTCEQEPAPSKSNTRLKQLFKKIAVKCHPDKLASQNLSSREMHFRLSSYESARVALEEEDEAFLVSVGANLDIIGELGIKGSCDILNESAHCFEQKVSELKGTPIWSWGTAGDDMQLKAKILCAVLQHSLGQNIEFERALQAIRSFYALPPEKRKPGQRPGMGLRRERR